MLVDTSVWIDHFRRSNHDLLLASAKLSRQPLWTADRRLRTAAIELDITEPG